MGYYSTSPKGTRLELQVRPRAGRNRIIGVQSDRLKVEIKAPDEGGKANAALLRFMAKMLGVPSSSVSILTGKTARKKTLLVSEKLDCALLEDLATPKSSRTKRGSGSTG